MRQQNEVKPTQFSNMREVWLETLSLLAKPFPSVELPDWPMWNEITGGFRSREYTILCGSTGAGKTTFLANMSAQLLKRGVKHFVMSVETGRHDYLIRVVSVLEGRDLNIGKAVSADALAQLHVKHTQLLESGVIEFSLYENRVPVEQLIADLKFMYAKGCRIAFIDNINFFMEVTNSRDQVVEMDRVTHELIVFCKQVDMHIVMVMHPRKCEGEARILTEFDIKGSSTAVQEAHNVFLFNRPLIRDVENGKRHITDREFLVRKMRRRGWNFGRTIIFNNRFTKYVEEDVV